MITSSSSCDFTITSPDGAVQNRTYQWRQHIVYESCQHDELSRVAPPSQQLSVDQIFVMFDPENELIRYAMTAKMGSVHSEFKGDPCVSPGHVCDGADEAPGGENFLSHVSVAGRSQEGKQKPDPGSVSPAAVREEEEAGGRGVGPDTNILTRWGEGGMHQC